MKDAETASPARKQSRVNIVDALRRENLRSDLPDFRIGDTIVLNVLIQEGNKSRVQAFEGVVMARQGTGREESVTVRKISSGVAVERVFPLQSPALDSVLLKKQGKVRRAKLFYLREKTGRQARIREKTRG